MDTDRGMHLTGRLSLASSEYPSEFDITPRGLVPLSDMSECSTPHAVKVGALSTAEESSPASDGEMLSWPSSPEQRSALKHLDDQDPLKRIVSLITLAKVSQHGDQQAICMMCTLRSDTDPRVRRALMDTLRELCIRGDQRALAAARALLQDESNIVRIAAVQVLRRISEVGDERTIGELCSCLDDIDRKVVTTSLSALCDLAPMNNQQAINGLTSLLDHHDDESICRQGRKALAQLSGLSREPS